MDRSSKLRSQTKALPVLKQIKTVLLWYRPGLFLIGFLLQVRPVKSFYSNVQKYTLSKQNKVQLHTGTNKNVTHTSFEPRTIRTRGIGFQDIIPLDQGSAGSWCSRAKFKVSKRFAGRSFSFSDLYKTFWFQFYSHQINFQFL